MQTLFCDTNCCDHLLVNVSMDSILWNLANHPFCIFSCNVCFSCRIAGVFNARLHLQNWDFLAPSRKCCVKLYFEGDLVGIFVWMLMSLLISQVSAANGITPQPPVSGAVNLTSRKAPYKSRRRPLQVRFPCWKTMYVKWTFIHGKLTCWNCVSRSPVDSSSHQLRLWQAECQHRAEMLISWCLAAKSATYYKACHQMAQKITNDSLSRGP